MRTHFAEILARESACLAGITNEAMLASWRRRIVEEFMTPRSPYVLALQQTGDVPDRVDFLDQWRELIAETVDRLLQPGATVDTPRPSAQAPRAGADAQKTAMLILAALHGWQHPESDCTRPSAAQRRARAFCGNRGQQPRENGERVAHLVTWTCYDDR